MLSKSDIGKLFVIFQARYGHKWTSAYDNPEIMSIAISEWHRELQGLRHEDISRGMDGWDESWPPSLPEFYRICMPSLNDLGYDIAAEVEKRLPKYTYRPSNDFEETARRKERAEIQKEVIKDLILDAKVSIREKGVTALITEDRKMLQ